MKNDIHTVMCFIDEAAYAAEWAGYRAIKNHPMGERLGKDNVIRSERLGVEIHTKPIKGIGRTRNAFVLVTLFGGDNGNPEQDGAFVHESAPMNAKQAAIAFVTECFKRYMVKRMDDLQE